MSLTPRLDEAISARWAKFVQNYGPRDILYGGTFMLHAVIYWGYGLLVLGVDRFKWPMCIYQYKIQKKKSDDNFRNGSLVKLVKNVLLNQFLFVLLPLVFAYKYLGNRVASKILNKPVPSTLRLIAELVGLFQSGNFCFYFSHRALHHEKIYKQFHRIHHEFTAPTALSAEYAHPVEYLFGNILPYAIAPLLIRPHAITQFLFVMMGLLTTMNGHSGYSIPFLNAINGDPRIHDFHHNAFRWNFGEWWMDRWFGTDNPKLFHEYCVKHPANLSKPE